jgi:hypothetical protein
MSKSKALWFLLLGFWVAEARGGGPEGLSARLLAEVQSPGDLPSGHYAAAGVWKAAGQLARIGGRIVTDSNAKSGEAWEVRVPAEAETRPGDQPGYIVFGLYRETSAGRYLAMFRLKRTGDAAGDVALVDAAVGGGRTVASAVCKADSLPPGQYRYVALRFAYPGGKLETRVFWHGKAALAVDSITLWREALPK